MERTVTVLATPSPPQGWRQEAAFLDAIAQVTFGGHLSFQRRLWGWLATIFQAATTKRLQKARTLSLETNEKIGNLSKEIGLMKKKWELQE